MSYIGKQPTFNSIQKLDSLTFNGVTTTFNLTSNGAVVYPGIATALIISLNGVIQNPGVSYTVLNNQLVFSVAPIISDSFFGVMLGQSFNLPNALALTGGTMTGDITFSGTQTFPSSVVTTTTEQTLTNKTISFASNTLTGVAPLASPTFTGVPAAPTAAVGTNTTQLATTAHVFAERAATVTLTNKTLSNPIINNYARFTSQHNAGNSGTSITLDFANGQKQLLTLTGNCTVTLSFPGVGNYQVLLSQDGVGGRTVTWSGVTRWVGSAGAPAINTAINTTTVVSIYYDGTNTWLGASKVNA
jgi:hypothetical protein